MVIKLEALGYLLIEAVEGPRDLVGERGGSRRRISTAGTRSASGSCLWERPWIAKTLRACSSRWRSMIAPWWWRIMDDDWGDCWNAWVLMFHRFESESL